MFARILLFTTIAGCAGAAAPPPERPGSRGMRASEHLAAAQDEDRLLQQHLSSPAQAPFEPGRVDTAATWYRTWDTDDHEQRARVHRSAAAKIQVDYEAACQGLPAELIGVSPLKRYGEAGTEIADGVVIYLSPDAGSPERLLAELDCHRAWMMLEPAGMDDCPLDLAGLHIDAHGDHTGIELTLTIRDRSLIAELQRRAAHDLEAAAARHRAEQR